MFRIESFFATSELVPLVSSGGDALEAACPSKVSFRNKCELFLLYLLADSKLGFQEMATSEVMFFSTLMA
jgi:hypothetical protein